MEENFKLVRQEIFHRASTFSPGIFSDSLQVEYAGVTHPKFMQICYSFWWAKPGVFLQFLLAHSSTPVVGLSVFPFGKLLPYAGLKCRLGAKVFPQSRSHFTPVFGEFQFLFAGNDYRPTRKLQIKGNAKVDQHHHRHLKSSIRLIL